jgi:hypothetical protein
VNKLTEYDNVALSGLKKGDLIFWNIQGYGAKQIDEGEPFLVLCFERQLGFGFSHRIDVIFFDVNKNRKYFHTGNDNYFLIRCKKV